MIKKASLKKGQSAVEYLILCAAVTVVVLVGFDGEHGFLLDARDRAGGLFNQALRGIMGTPATDAARSGIDSRSGPLGYP